MIGQCALDPLSIAMVGPFKLFEGAIKFIFSSGCDPSPSVRGPS